MPQAAVETDGSGHRGGQCRPILSVPHHQRQHETVANVQGNRRVGADDRQVEVINRRVRLTRLGHRLDFIVRERSRNFLFGVEVKDLGDKATMSASVVEGNAVSAR
jgi:hypothetical protein